MRSEFEYHGDAQADRVVAHASKPATERDRVTDEGADVIGRWTTAHPCIEIDFAFR